MTLPDRAIDPMATINELILTDPATIPVLNALGVDTCCGGDATLDELTRHRGLDLDGLVATLAATRAQEEGRR